jgi:RNase P subunit RPR2
VTTNPGNGAVPALSVPQVRRGGCLIRSTVAASRVGRVAISAPDSTTRWRCARCGNLTRFDVVRSTRSTQYWHFDLAGEVSVEEENVVEDEIQAVTCRWCGATDTVELIARVEDV